MFSDLPGTRLLKAQLIFQRTGIEKLWLMIQPQPVFINQVSLGHSHTHLFKDCLWSLSNGRVNSCDRDDLASQSLGYLLSRLYRKISFDDCLEEGSTKYLCLLWLNRDLLAKGSCGRNSPRTRKGLEKPDLTFIFVISVQMAQSW